MLFTYLPIKVTFYSHVKISEGSCEFRSFEWKIRGQPHIWQVEAWFLHFPQVSLCLPTAWQFHSWPTSWEASDGTALAAGVLNPGHPGERTGWRAGAAANGIEIHVRVEADALTWSSLDVFFSPTMGTNSIWWYHLSFWSRACDGLMKDMKDIFPHMARCPWHSAIVFFWNTWDQSTVNRESIERLGGAIKSSIAYSHLSIRYIYIYGG